MKKLPTEPATTIAGYDIEDLKKGFGKDLKKATVIWGTIFLDKDLRKRVKQLDRLQAILQTFCDGKLDIVFSNTPACSAWIVHDKDLHLRKSKKNDALGIKTGDIFDAGDPVDPHVHFLCRTLGKGGRTVATWAKLARALGADWFQAVREEKTGSNKGFYGTLGYFIHRYKNNKFLYSVYDLHLINFDEKRKARLIKKLTSEGDLTPIQVKANQLRKIIYANRIATEQDLYTLLEEQYAYDNGLKKVLLTPGYHNMVKDWIYSRNYRNSTVKPAKNVDSDLKSEVKELAKQVSKLTDKVEKLSQEKAELKSENEQLHQKVDGKDDLISDLSESNKRKDKKIAELKSEKVKNQDAVESRKSVSKRISDTNVRLSKSDNKTSEKGQDKPEENGGGDTIDISDDDLPF